MEVIFYSTHCPRCTVLEKKLQQKKIQYIENNNVGDMLELGIQSAPALKVDGEIMDFTKAVQWINQQGEQI